MKAPVTTAAESPESRPIGRLVVFFLAFSFSIIFIVLLTGYLVYNGYKAPRHDSKPVAAGVHVAPFVTLTDGDSFPVGLSGTGNGTFYLTEFGTGAVLKVSPDGTTSAWIPPHGGQVTAGGAVALGPDGALYAIDYAATDPRSAYGSLRRITPDGKVTSYGSIANKLPLFAQLAFDGGGFLYMTDPATAQVWRFDRQGVETRWWAAAAVGNDSALPTGIAYDPTHNAMIIADAGTGTIYRVSIDDKGLASNPLVLYRQAGADIKAVTVNDQGQVLMAVWAHDNGQISRLEADGTITTLADGFRAPSALVQRGSKVYVVNSDLLGLVPPLFFGLVESPVRAKPPFTIDVVDLGTSGPGSQNF